MAFISYKYVVRVVLYNYMYKRKNQAMYILYILYIPSYVYIHIRRRGIEKQIFFFRFLFKIYIYIIIMTEETDMIPNNSNNIHYYSRYYTNYDNTKRTEHKCSVVYNIH